MKHFLIRIPILLAFLLTTIISSAQTKTDKASVSWSEEMSISKNGSFRGVVGHNEDNVYQLIENRKDLYIQKMNKDLVVLAKEELDHEHNDKDMNFEDLIVFHDNYLVFLSQYDKKTDQKTLFLRLGDSGSLKERPGQTELASVTSRKKDRISFDVRISPDSSKILVYYQLPFERQGQEKFGLKVFNENMDVYWEDEVELPYADDHFSIENFKVMDDGTVLVVGVKYEDKRTTKRLKRQEKSYYEYHVLVYEDAHAEVKDYEIELDDWFIQDLQLAIGDDGNIIGAGFYSTRGTWSIRGTFFVTFDRETKDVIHKSFKEFDEDFMTMYMTEKEERKAKKKADKKDKELEMYEYDLSDIILRDDGGAILVAEQYYSYVVTTRSTDSNGITTTRYTYHYIYNDVVVVNMNSSGEIDWAAKVPKRQHTINDGGFYSGFGLTVVDDKMYFIYNDNGKNLYLKEGEKIFNFNAKKDFLVMLSTVGVDGSVERETLFALDKKDILLAPKESIEFDDQLFLYAQRKKNYKYGRVDLE